MSILNQHRAQLDALLARGHAKFGQVAPRKPYQEDGTGAGSAGLTIEGHPLLSNLPDGAPSNLTSIINDSHVPELLERSEDLTYELKQQLQNKNELKHTAKPSSAPTPKPH
jgi:hypothetical protein